MTWVLVFVLISSNQVEFHPMASADACLNALREYRKYKPFGFEMQCMNTQTGEVINR